VTQSRCPRLSSGQHVHSGRFYKQYDAYSGFWLSDVFVVPIANHLVPNFSRAPEVGALGFYIPG